MSQASSLRARQTLALLILAGIAAIAWKIVVLPVIDLVISRQSEIESLSTRIEEVRALESQTPTLSHREQLAIQKLNSLNVFWNGPSQAAVAVSIQDVIRNAATQSGGVVTSASILSSNETADTSMVVVRARVDGSIDTLQHVLTIVSTAAPKLFVDNLTVSTVSPSSTTRPLQLSFEFSVGGYVAAYLNAH